MGISLFPKTVKFFELFKKQNQKVVDAACLLDNIFSEFTDVKEKCKLINQIEVEGNLLSRDIARELASTFITPIDREDIHEINMAQEDIQNIIRSIATRISFYSFSHIPDAARHLVKYLRLILEETGHMLSCLAAKNDVCEQIEKINNFRKETEIFFLAALGEIYER
ncbi:MAG: DUF47 family protein, partial [Deltaproteobacteria bacterium]|nr:DUF47 family protein [Deltaproteobacteria bacterium]